MKAFYLAGLCAGLLGLPALARGQAAPVSSSARPLPAVAALPPQPTQRMALGGPPQVLADLDDTADLDALLHQLEEATRQPLSPTAQAQVSVSTLLELTRQLAATRQQVAGLRRQLADTQRIAASLLLDQTELTDLRQQLSLLQSQQAAATATRHFRPLGWPAE